MRTKWIFGTIVSFAVIFCTAAGIAYQKNGCQPSYSLDSVREVVVDDAAKFVSNEIEIIIDRPVKDVFDWVVYQPLEVQLRGTDELPGVRSTQSLNDKKVGEKGYRRIVFLEDGNSALEEVIQNDRETYFSYKVWNYTLKIAENIDYAKGEWWFTPLEGNSKTHIRWKYSFKLNNRKLFGRLGPLGRFIFNRFFIKTKYNEFMETTLDKTRRDLES